MRAVEDAIARQVLHGGDLPTNLLELGAVSEPLLTVVLAESFGLDPAPAGKLPAPPDQVLRVIPGDLAVRHGIFPLALEERSLVLATAEPLSNVVEDDLGFALDVSIKQLAAPLVRVRQAIAEHYGIALDRRLSRLVAKLDGRHDPSPSTAPPPADLFPLRPPRPISIPVPGFGTGVDSDDERRAPAPLPSPANPAIPAHAPVPRDLDPERLPGGPRTARVGMLLHPEPLSSLPSPTSTSPLPFLEGIASRLNPPPSSEPVADRPYPSKRTTITGMPMIRPDMLEPEAPAQGASAPEVAAPAPQAAPASEIAAPAPHAAAPLPEAAAPAPHAAAPAPHASASVSEAAAPIAAGASLAAAAPRAEAAATPAQGQAAAPQGKRVLAGWVRHELRGGALVEKASGESPALRAPRRRGPFTAEMAEEELAEAATTDAVLEVFFTFALQFFEYSALFVVHGDIAEGRNASGPGAHRARVAGIGVPLDLPSSLAKARERRAPLIAPLAREGLDAELVRDLGRSVEGPARAAALVPLVVRNRTVAILYGDDGEMDVSLSTIGDVISVSGLVGTAIERIARRKKLGPRAELPLRRTAPPAAAAERPKASGLAALASALATPDAPRDSTPPADAPEPAREAEGEQPPSPGAPAADLDRAGPPSSVARVSLADTEPPPRPPAGAAPAEEVPRMPPLPAIEAADDPRPLAPPSDKTIVMPPSDKAMFAPASDTTIVAPPSDKRAAAPASEQTLVTPPSEQTLVTPPSEKTIDEPAFASMPEEEQTVDESASLEYEMLVASMAAARAAREQAQRGEAKDPEDAPATVREQAEKIEQEVLVREGGGVVDPGSNVAMFQASDRRAPGDAPTLSSLHDESAETISRAFGRMVGDAAAPQVAGGSAEEGASRDRISPTPGGPRPARRGTAPIYTGRSKAQASTLEPLPRTPPPNATAWTSFPSPPPPQVMARPPLSDRPIPREDDDEGDDASGASLVAAMDPTPAPPVDEVGAPGSGSGSPSAPGSGAPSSASAGSKRGKASPLPSVIVDVAAEYASLLARFIEGGPGSQEAFNDLVRHGEQVIQPLIARFPGPLRVDRHRARAELPAASQCGPILELIVAIRRPALPFISVRTSSPDVEIRFWATHVLGELRYPEAANVLVPRLFDDDASVRRIARRSASALVGAGPAGAPILQGLDNITRNVDQPIPHRILAIETMGEIRSGAMVQPLIAVLSDPADDIGDAARRALLMITRQDFGRDPRRWQEWWIRNTGRHRIEWLMDALMHEQPSLRRAAGDELKILTKEYFGYYDDLPKKDRERAQALYRAWWEREGRDRFS